MLVDIPEQLVILHSVHHRDLAAHCTGSKVTSPVSNTSRELLAHTAAMKTMYTQRGTEPPPLEKQNKTKTQRKCKPKNTQKTKAHNTFNIKHLYTDLIYGFSIKEQKDHFITTKQSNEIITLRA